MNIYLDESECKSKLYPLTATRHTADIRLGILTIREKWELLTGSKVSIQKAEGYEQVPANLVPLKDYNKDSGSSVPFFEYPWHLFQMNDREIRKDFELITKGRSSSPIPAGNQFLNPDEIFIEPGAKLKFSILNAESGPIYIGKNAEVMEGSMIRGPFSLGENSVVKMGSKIYGGTSVGPNSVVGGEIKNSIIFGNSNKAHDGYLGDSVIAEWCNLGAGTSNSNVKNTGGEVRYQTADSYHNAGMKAGLIMGDYSRSAINTSFTTGTLVGICCNIFGENPPRFIPDFSWGKEKYILEKALTDIQNWKRMKNQVLNPDEIIMLKKLYLNI